MRRVIEKCINGIPFNTCSQRAIDETLADWVHEEHQSINRGRKALVALQGMLSIVRVVSASLLRESIDFGWCRGLSHRWSVVAVCVALLAAAQALFLYNSHRGLSFESLILALPLVPMSLLAILPPALFLIFAWRPAGRGLPTAGAASLLALALLLLAGLLVPLSGKAVKYLLFSSSDMITAGVNAMRYASDSISPIAAALHVMSWPFLGAAVAMFAIKLARRSPLRSPWWLAGVPLIYAGFVPMLQLAIGTSFLVVRTAGSGETPGEALALLATAAILMSLAIAYHHGEAQIPAGPSVNTN